MLGQSSTSNLLVPPEKGLLTGHHLPSKLLTTLEMCQQQKQSHRDLRCSTIFAIDFIQQQPNDREIHMLVTETLVNIYKTSKLREVMFSKQLYLFLIHKYSHPEFLSSHLLPEFFLLTSAAPPGNKTKTKNKPQNKTMSISFCIQRSPQFCILVFFSKCVEVLTRFACKRFEYRTSFSSCD